MRIALGQFGGTLGDVVANLRLAQSLAQDAARLGADLLVLPELFLTGYNIGDAVARLAEPSDGPSAQAMAGIAEAAGLAIVYGYPERASDGVYNAALAIDASGHRLANYRKLRLWGDFEGAQFRAGTEPVALPLGGLRFDLQICYDLDFPEFSRAAARSGADGIIVISATTAPYAVVPRHLVPARAYENQLFVVFADRPGAEGSLRYAGESCVAAPDGSILASAGAGEALICAEVDAARYAAYRREHRPRA
ncbi:MAG TPA: carbon-nitrogen hydrolase family protein [Kiloniellales bacterium]|nr:carbon-nitrogen hydrolase family protein [Kiloniellales bacterium]